MKQIFMMVGLILISFSLCIGQTVKNQSLADQIKKMYELDQKVQTDIVTAFQNGASPEKKDELFKIQSETFKHHIPILKKIISENGYPTYDLIGQEAGNNFFTMVQHSDADLNFQRRH